MRAWLRWGPLAALAVLAGLFAYWNAAERVAVHLGLATLYGVSLPVLVFGAFLLGMIVMFLIGLKHDLRIRRALRRSGLERLPEERARDRKRERKSSFDEIESPW